MFIMKDEKNNVLCALIIYFPMKGIEAFFFLEFTVNEFLLCGLKDILTTALPPWDTYS